MERLRAVFLVWILILLAWNTGCTGPLEPPSCEEISQTVYSYDVTRLPAEQAENFRVGVRVLARDLKTTIQEVPSCNGIPYCYTVFEDPSLPYAVGGRANDKNQILLSPRLKSFTPRETSHVAMHEFVHQIRLDTLQTDYARHDPEGGLMAVQDMGESIDRISAHDLAYICQ